MPSECFQIRILGFDVKAFVLAADKSMVLKVK